MSNGYRISFDEMLKCSICQDRIKDARSLPCGHTYCKDCLTRFADATLSRGSIICSECKKTSQLPPQGIDGLPVAYRINSIVSEITSNETSDNRSHPSSSSQNRMCQPPVHRQSPDTRCRPLMEDVDAAKRRAQARAGYQIQVFVRQINGKTLAINISPNANVSDLQQEIQTRTNIERGQQRLTFSGQALDDKMRTLSSYGIDNHSNIDMNVRLRGGI